MREQEIRERVSAITVGIAGCGGLGSNCAVALARVGIGKLILADFDVVDLSNLNRQYYFRHQLGIPKVEALMENIRLIDPEVTVEIHQVRLDSASVLQLFSSCNVVAEAFDGAEQKGMLIETMAARLPWIPLVSGMGMAGFGNFHLIRIEKHGNLYVCGDQCSEVSAHNPPLAPRVGIVAHLQANIILEILLNSTSEATHFPL